MAPNFTSDEREHIRCLLSDDKLSNAEIARHVPFRCSKTAVQRIRTNLKCYDSTTAPRNGGGRPRRLTAEMRSFLHGEMRRQPYLYMSEMADLLEQNFLDQAQPSQPTIYRYLHECGITRKKAYRTASQRDTDLVDRHNYDRDQFSSEQLVFIDESGLNKHDGFRPFAWGPKGKSARQTTRLD